MYELHELCQKGDIESLKKYLIENDFKNLHEKDKDNKTILSIACEKGHIDIVKFVIENSSIDSLKYRDRCYRTPLHWACMNNQIDVVKYLISINGHIFIKENHCDRDHDGTTAFACACINGHSNIVKLFIEAEGFSDLNNPDAYGTTPFMWACTEGNLDVVKILLSTEGFTGLNEGDTRSKEDEYEKYRVPIFFACCCGHVAIVRELLKQPNIIIPNKLDFNRDISSENQKYIQELIKSHKKNIDLVECNESVEEKSNEQIKMYEINI
jgi:hypothetical protein